MKRITNQPIGINRLDQFVDDFFNRGLNAFIGSDHFASQPLVNVFESNTEYTLEIAAPGLEKSDFEVRVEGDFLIVSAQKAGEQSEEGDDKFLRKEFSYSTFSRSFRLPKHTVLEDIKAGYDQGVLKLRIPKSETQVQKYRAIEIL